MTALRAKLGNSSELKFLSDEPIAQRAVDYDRESSGAFASGEIDDRSNGACDSNTIDENPILEGPFVGCVHHDTAPSGEGAAFQRDVEGKFNFAKGVEAENRGGRFVRDTSARFDIEDVRRRIVYRGGRS